MRKIVVIGAGAAGLAAATRARRVDPTAQITVLEASKEYSRGTCSLPYYISGEVAHRENLIGTSREALAEASISLELETPVLSIDAQQRRVRIAHRELPYDRLVVCTGSQPRPVPITSGSSANPSRLWSLRSTADADKIKAELETIGPQRVAIVGGGYLGLEMAEVLANKGIEISIFHRPSHLMRLTSPCHQALRALLATRRIRLFTGCDVRLVDPTCRTRTLEYLDHEGQRHSAGFDAVFLAAGVKPKAQLLAETGARVGAHGGAIVDSRGETSLSGILAAGDGVEIPARQGGATRYVPLATVAARLGRVCGENAAGGSLRLPETLATIAVRLFDYQVASVGYPADWSQAEQHNVDFGTPHPAFSRRQLGRATFLTEPRGGRLLGAQFVSPEAASLADLAAIAMNQEMTLKDLLTLDLSYTPPLSQLWHPFYLAARQAEKLPSGALR